MSDKYESPILKDRRDNMFYTSDMSRRARGIEIWATLKGLGKEGVSQLVWELHKKAQYFARTLAEKGFEVLNDVVFNQVLVHCESNELTSQLTKALQASGVCWVGGATWHSRTVIRISVSSYRTSYEDIDITVEDFLRQRDLIKMK